MSILIKNAYIVTMDKDGAGEIENGFLLIENNLISKIGDNSNNAADSISAGTVIDAKGAILMPGLSNTHTHLGMTLLRGYADDMALQAWLETKIWPAEANLTAEDVYYGSLLGCLEMIRSGTTAFCDMYFFMDETAKAVEKAGIRGCLSYGMIEFGDEEKGNKELATNEKLVRDWQGKANGRITTMYGPHAPNTCCQSFIGRSKEAAERDGVGVHIHVLETEAELNQMKENHGMCSVHHLDAVDFWNTEKIPVLAAHCVWMSDGDIKLFAKKGVTVSHNPISNMKLASGIAPIQKMLDAGVSVSLGTDGCASNNNLNLFEEMKTAALLQKVGTMSPTALPAKAVVEMATVNGGRVIDKQTGVLKAGNKADMILVDIQKANATPVFDVYSHLVYAAAGSDVKTMIVDGKILMENYKVLVMDEEEVMKKAKECAFSLAERAKPKK
ncbi:amidohydrolase family protein [Methanimicrococcus blatticola]|uniref:5'-deoxyadenosine deaminase n=1 Tax=Methanimicrococcus blatticola TaxID=91560 RepID=A0A484F5A5_9EURY|nr:amidohydrolase family protein [Methanimicrococcus blatticola]MBZ3936080.1 amidohydrolase family protein [Methanimicrococcus blatticola]MCC2509311.1 amidohydrolase family protein [Methanimicrococcus blatticola]TDQ68196.1 5-methylthioadenosine/S-adenosylhomocysteine deaminase [Methanimicrococcus blatticola]